MRLWNWLWTLSGLVGVGLCLFKHRLTVFQIRVAKRDGLWDDPINRTLLIKYRRDTFIRGFILSVVLFIGVASFSRPAPPPFEVWDWITYLNIIGFESIAVATMVGVAFDLRDRLRLIYGSVRGWWEAEVSKSRAGREP